MKKKKLPLVCWDSIKLLTALFLLWGVCFGADAYPGSEYRKQLFDYDWKFKLGDYPDASLIHTMTLIGGYLICLMTGV